MRSDTPRMPKPGSSLSKIIRHNRPLPRSRSKMNRSPCPRSGENLFLLADETTATFLTPERENQPPQPCLQPSSFLPQPMPMPYPPHCWRLGRPASRPSAKRIQKRESSYCLNATATCATKPGTLLFSRRLDRTAPTFGGQNGDFSIFAWHNPCD